MANRRVNPPPMVTFPQRNPFSPRSAEGLFIGQLISALNSQRIVIEQLWRRSGAGVDLTAETILREVYAWEVDEGKSVINDTSSPFYTEFQDSSNSDLFSVEDLPSSVVHFAPEHQEAGFNAITKATDYTLISFDYVNFTSNATATFPANPGQNDKVKIRKGGGNRIKLDGNGKDINGSSTGNIYNNGTSITFCYFIDTDEWFAA